MLAMHPADNSQRSAQSEMIRAPYGSGCATPAHRYQESSVGAVKWVGILLQALCTLVAIAMVHSDTGVPAL